MTKVTDPSLLAILNGGGAAQPSVTALPESASRIADRQRDDAAANRDEIRTGIAVREESRKVENTDKDYTLKLRSDFETTPAVKEYRAALPMFVSGLKSANTPQGSNHLIYSYAKLMDPTSVVREGEAASVSSSDTVFGRAYAYAQKQLDGTGTFSPEAREGLLREMRTRAIELARAYDAQRNRYAQDAQAWGLDPARVVGPHDGAAFVAELDQIDRQERRGQYAQESLNTESEAGGAEEEGLKVVVSDETPSPYDPGGPFNPTTPNQYHDSYLGQGMSGLNEGIASILGAPVDLVATAMNLVPQGLNAAANTNIPTIDNPVMGSDWFKDRMSGWGIYEPTADPSKQFTRRVGESIGAAAVPAGFAGTLPRIASAITAGAGGGVGAATAQQAFPNNALAEIGGEVLGGGLTGLGLARVAQGQAQRAIERRVPSTEDLRQQAGDLYRAAEAGGTVADPSLTQQLADDMRGTLLREGQLGPNGRITDADTNTTRAFNLIEQYAGREMRPTEMDTVRRVIADGRRSPDASDQRLAGIMLEQFDNWTRPLAPQFDEARSVASRYLQAEDLEQARELAGARAGQFSGSGFENALRTEYRGLDRSTIRGREQFTPEVTSAIQNVSRGTPASNLARNVGRFAPTGVVSAGLGTGGPIALGTMLGGPATGLALGTAAATVGTLGRVAATRMGLRNAEVAELTARNGGAIPQAPMLPPEVQRQVDTYIAAQAAKYLTEDDQPTGTESHEGSGNPEPLARRERKKPLPRGLFGSAR